MTIIRSDIFDGRGETIVDGTTDVGAGGVNSHFVWYDLGGGSAVFDSNVGTPYGLDINDYKYAYDDGLANLTDFWMTFIGLRIPSNPSGNILIGNAYDGTSRNAELQLQSNRTLRVRNGVATAQGALTCASPLDTAKTYDAAWRVRASDGYCELKVYEDRVLVHDLDATISMSGVNTDIARAGFIAPITANMHLDALYFGTTEFIPGPTTVDYVIRGIFADNDDALTSWQVDTSGNTGVVALAQTGGATATVNADTPTSGIFEIINPGGVDDLVFNLTLDGGGDTPFTLTRGGGARRWAYDGSNWG